MSHCRTFFVNQNQDFYVDLCEYIQNEANLLSTQYQIVSYVSQIQFYILPQPFSYKHFLGQSYKIASQAYNFYNWQQMKEQPSKLSDIYKQILKVMQNHPTPQSLKNKHFLDQLTVIYLNKKPATHTFICDSKMSIQVQLKTQKSKPIQEYDLNPFNKVMTHYYQVSHEHNKHLFTLNCNDRTLFQKYNIKVQSISETHYNQDRLLDQNRGGMFPEDQDSEGFLSHIQKDYEPNAYEPLFYFPRNNFDLFIKNRNNLTLPDPLQKIIIYDWVLKVVNMSKCGSYSLIMEIHKFKFLNEKIWVDGSQTQKESKNLNFQLKNVGSIIYDQKLQYILQKIRIKHVRQELAKQPYQSQQEQISMCYHLRNVQATHKLPKMSQFVTLDKQGEVLKFDNNLPVHFVPVGQLQGMCSFPQPVNLNKQQRQQHLRDLNTFSMKGLFQILNKEVNEVSKRKNQSGRFKNKKHKIENRDFNKMIEERLENSHYRINQRQNQVLNFSFSDDQQQESLHSDQHPENKNQNQHLSIQQSNQGQNKLQSQYSNILNNSNESSQSSQEQQNEYFRKYRQEMKKTFSK